MTDTSDRGDGGADPPDPLTGLPRRGAALTWLGGALAASDDEHQVGVVLLDVDRFSRLNDSLRMTAGDIVLQVLGRRLQSAAARHGGTAARVGGDEFAVVLPSLSGQEEAERVVRALLDSTFSEPVRVVGRPMQLTGTGGIAL